MLAYAGFGLTYPQFSVLITGRGFSLQVLGLIQAMATLLSIISVVFIGKLSDRLNRRKPFLAAGLLMTVPVLGLFPHARSLGLFVVLLAVYQLGTSLLASAAANWVARFGTQGQLGRLHGYYRISFSFGWVVSTAAMGMVLDRLGTEASFYLGALLAGLASLAVILFAEDTDREPVPAAGEASEFGTHYIWPVQLKLIIAALGIFTLAQTMGAQLNYIFLREDMQVTNRQFGLLSSVQSWPEIPLMILLGIMSDKVSNRALVAVGMGLAGLRWLLLASASGVAELYFIQPIHAVAITITDVVVVAVITRQVPSRFLGAVMGWQVAVASAAKLAAPLLAGVVGHHFGIRTVFVLAALISAAAGLLAAGPGRKST